MANIEISCVMNLMMNILVSSVVNLMMNWAIKDIQWKCLHLRGDLCSATSETTERKRDDLRFLWWRWFTFFMMIYKFDDEEYQYFLDQCGPPSSKAPEVYSFTKSTAPSWGRSQGSMVATSFYGQEACTVPNFSRWRSDQKLPLSNQSGWALLAFSHLVGLCHPFPLTNSPVQIVIAHEDMENSMDTIWSFGTGKRLGQYFIRTRCLLICSAEVETNYHVGQIITSPMS